MNAVQMVDQISTIELQMSGVDLAAKAQKRYNQRLANGGFYWMWEKEWMKIEMTLVMEVSNLPFKKKKKIGWH